MKIELPLVSIIIPCFNSEKYISECIESVINQDYENIEIIIVNDGSTDSSVEVISRYEECFLYMQENSGACVARNYGLSKSRGKYIKFLDSDDFLEAGVIRKQVELAEKLDENNIVYGDYYLLIGRKKILKETFLNECEQTALLLIRDILTSTPLHRKWMLEKVNGFDERFINGQEWNLHVRLSSEGFNFHHMKFPVYCYRKHSGEDRISNRDIDNLEEIKNGIKKTKLTAEYLRSKSTGDTDAAVSFRYFLIARSFFRLGLVKDSYFYMSKAKSLSCNYKKYWPIGYRLMNSILGYYFSERLFNIAYNVKKIIKS